jgi:hypothetical protein
MSALLEVRRAFGLVPPEEELVISQTKLIASQALIIRQSSELIDLQKSQLASFAKADALAEKLIKGLQEEIADYKKLVDGYKTAHELQNKLIAAQQAQIDNRNADSSTT